jgi:parallel beta helix pectate lyase-like protein
MRTSARISVLFTLLLLALGVPAPRAETTNCTPITSLPFTISSPGIYCLTRNLGPSVTPDAAITVGANNVVLDLNGWILIGPTPSSGVRGYGVYAFQRQNVTIRNGTIRRFVYGIWLSDDIPATVSQNNVVEDIRAQDSIVAGILMAGRGNVARRNQVLGTGGSPVAAVNGSSVGIWMDGSEARVVDNDVMDTAKRGAGSARGIQFTNGTDNLAVSNRITRAEYGVHFAPGASGKYRDNLTNGVTVTPYSGGTDAGNNQ